MRTRSSRWRKRLRELEQAFQPVLLDGGGAPSTADITAWKRRAHGRPYLGVIATPRCDGWQLTGGLVSRRGCQRVRL